MISYYAQGKHFVTQKTQLEWTIFLLDLDTLFDFLGSHSKILCHHVDPAAKIVVFLGHRPQECGRAYYCFHLLTNHIILLSVIIKSLVADNLKSSRTDVSHSYSLHIYFDQSCCRQRSVSM